MQVKRLAAALVALAPLYAAAQSNVTLYGLLDGAIESVDAGGSIGRHTNVQSGNQSGSRFGFRGAEDLGMGVKAIFNLEAGVAVDTGAQDAAGLFQRRAVVGLEGDFGTLTLGREYSPLANIAGATDELGQGFYGNNLSSFSATRATRRLSNSINFKSASFSGVDVMFAYSAGENTAADQASGNLIAWGAEFKQGGLYVGGAYQTHKALVAGDTKEYGLGAGYTFAELGGFEIKGNYITVDPIGASNNYKQYNLGAGYPFGASKFYVNLQQSKMDSGAKGTAVALAYSYSLSKRTNLYASYARMNNNGTGAFTLNSGSNTVTPAGAGVDPSALTVGIRHTF
jgi:predicted porin